MFSRTPRLLLRPGWVEDAPALTRAIGQEAVVRNLAHAPWPYTLEDARDFLTLADDPQQPRFLVFARTGGAPRLVGGVGIGRDPDGAPEIGYWVERMSWGLGYATEASRAVLDIARAMDLGPLVAGHFLDNPASGRVLRKLGFRPTGRIVQRHSRARGGPAAFAAYAEEGGVADLDMPRLRAA
ncbi:MAG: GNAT family N-acetyltransferase [Sphingomonas sp. SCN 67-18]|uniref:GNAT family N-acetyltransferase n=1 Tax=uncultured Sphingomonas sp. TaxID=158754 RepID=UPI00086A5932|nr:GNAT family N-acetyltransferase [Sphingomonas sp. SCN 67-18]ODU20049.1 MAG: GNAT family N-acetyltransferase [Sphingomonas sp. SCN 67-18]